MSTRTRIALPSVVLLLAGLASACGGSGAPADASKKDFCETQTSVLKDLIPDMGDMEDLDNMEMPSSSKMADAMHRWADRMEKVGTPKGISQDARAGFELILEQARKIKASDFDKAAKDQDFNPFEGDLSGEEKKQAEAYSSYVTDTCGGFGSLDAPELPSPTQ